MGEIRQLLKRLLEARTTADENNLDAAIDRKT